METISLNAALGKVRYVTVDGRRFAVAPAVLIDPAVVMSGSKGSLYYPPEETKRPASTWDTVPMTVNHPVSPVGEHISAFHPDAHRVWIGYLRNTRFNGKLRTTLWFDEELTKKVEPRIWASLERNEPIDLSTGLFTTNEPTQGVVNGRPYEYIARDHVPDHVAILVDQRGACSRDDGCGVLMNADQPRDAQGRFAKGGGGGSDVLDEAEGEASDEEIDKFVDHYGEWMESVPSAQAEACERYGYKWDSIVNDQLRGRDTGTANTEDLAKAKGYAKELDALIDSAPTLHRDTAFYRGVSGDLAKGLLGKQPGDTLTDKGFTSVTTAPEVADNFAGGAKLRVVAAAGSKIAPIGFATGTGENEWLLPRGAQLKVTRVEGNTIHAEYGRGEAVANKTFWRRIAEKLLFNGRDDRTGHFTMGGGKPSPKQTHAAVQDGSGLGKPDGDDDSDEDDAVEALRQLGAYNAWTDAARKAAADARKGATEASDKANKSNAPADHKAAANAHLDAAQKALGAEDAAGAKEHIDLAKKHASVGGLTKNAWSDAAREAAAAARAATKEANRLTDEAPHRGLGPKQAEVHTQGKVGNHAKAAKLHSEMAELHAQATGDADQAAASAHRAAAKAHAKAQSLETTENAAECPQCGGKGKGDCECNDGGTALVGRKNAPDDGRDVDELERTPAVLIQEDDHARNTMGLNWNKEFTSDSERKAAFAHMNEGGSTSAPAKEASAKAGKTGKASDHKAAAAAHREAAKSHKEEGNDVLAQAHASAASHHSKMAGAATRKEKVANMDRSELVSALSANCRCEPKELAGLTDATLQRLALNEQEAIGKAGASVQAGGQEDDDEDESPEKVVVKGKTTMNELLANATSEDREVWNNAVEINRREKLTIVNRLTANVRNTSVRAERTQSLMKKSLKELNQLLDLLPEHASVSHSAPIYVGNAGGFEDEGGASNAFEDEGLPIMAMEY